MSEHILRFTVEPVPDCHPDIGLWLAILDSAREGTQFALRDLRDAELDQAPAIGINTIGTLLYHIALTDLVWIFDNMLQMKYPADVARLFPYPIRDHEGRLSVVSGWDLDTHQQRLRTARQTVHEVFKSMTVDSFRQIMRLTQDFGTIEMTPEAVARHLTLHETEHLGEIKLLLGAMRQPPQEG